MNSSNEERAALAEALRRPRQTPEVLAADAAAVHYYPED